MPLVGEWSALVNSAISHSLKDLVDLTVIMNPLNLLSCAVFDLGEKMWMVRTNESNGFGSHSF